MAIISGTCGEKLTWKFDEETKELTVEGEGVMEDCPSWYDYSSCIEKVNLPEGLLNISECTFSLCTKLRDIIIPKSVKEIGKRAFDSSGLLNIGIPDSVTKIGEYAFIGCKALRAVVLPDSIQEIGCDAFKPSNFGATRDTYLIENEFWVDTHYEFPKILVNKDHRHRIEKLLSHDMQRLVQTRNVSSHRQHRPLRKVDWEKCMMRALEEQRENQKK